MAVRREILQYELIDLKPDVAVGIKLPFSSKKGGLFELSYTTEDQALSNLKNLLLTRKGERMMQPNFGTLIYNLIFDQNYTGLDFKIKDTLLADIEYWLPYIIVSDITVTQHIDEEPGPIGHGIQIVLTVKVSDRGANTTITLNVDGNGTPTIET